MLPLISIFYDSLLLSEIMNGTLDRVDSVICQILSFSQVDKIITINRLMNE
jgi:hypothetical protein